MRMRKMSEKYHFDFAFYLLVLAFAGLIWGVSWYGKRSYDRYRGREVQALLDRENAISIEAFRKQAKNWVNNRTYGINLTAEERAKAEDIMAHGLHKYVQIWTQGQMNSQSKAEIDQVQKSSMDAALKELNEYLVSIGKTPRDLIS